MKKGKRFGFTLAEVLITLGVIGVVAAITIPILVQNYQKTQYATAAKKFYTSFNQVLQQMAVDNGTVDSIADYFPNEDGDTLDIAAIKIASYYKVAKVCGGTKRGECFAAFNDNHDGSFNGSGLWDSIVGSLYTFVTADGMSFAIGSYGTQCQDNAGVPWAPEVPANKTCGIVVVDINGAKKPNYQGRDVFQFYITSNRTPILYPLGGFYSGGNGTATTGGAGWWNYGNADKCGSNVDKNGSFCAGRLMEKGWVMDY